MEGRSNGGAGIARRGDNNRQIAVLAGLQPRQCSGQEARTDILERRRRPMEQLQHMVTVAQWPQRHRKVERLTTDRWQGCLQSITGEERCQ